MARPCKIASPAVAQSLGIGLVHQEIALCPDATVAENMFMVATNRRRSPLMNFARLERDAQAVMNRLAPIDVRRKVGDLPISSQQLVEIAKALTLDCRVLILDEPTAALTEAETQVLFGIIRDLKAHGISIIYISHRMAEIFSLCDRVTVFRDGRYVSTERILRPYARRSRCAAWSGVRSRNSTPKSNRWRSKASKPFFPVRNLGDGRALKMSASDCAREKFSGSAASSAPAEPRSPRVSAAFARPGARRRSTLGQRASGDLILCRRR